MRTFRMLVLAAGGLLLAGTAACTEKAGSADPANGPIAVIARDDACEVARTEVAAGTLAFSVANKGSKVTEFYVYGDGDRVEGEVENIPPGLTREVHLQLRPGTYQTACKPGMTGHGIRGALKVVGAASPLPEDALLTDATANYQRYVRTQTDGLLAKTGEFVAAVKAGDVAKAKALFPIARTYWERIEPVAEIFGDLDPKIDGREDVIAEGLKFTGFHRIEKDLWTTGNIAQDGPIADQLMADVRQIVNKANAETLNPVQLANGAKELLDEVATGKITGEEDRYSHTDLWDFSANVEGSQAAIAALRPALTKRAPDLVKQLDAQFANVTAELGEYRSGDGWKAHNELSQAQLKQLSDAVNALAEPVSKVAAVVAAK